MSKKKKGGDHGGGGGHDGAGGLRWLLTYTDMVTLLLALFIVMWAQNSQDQEKAEEIRAAFAVAFGQGQPSVLMSGAAEGAKPVYFENSTVRMQELKNKLKKYVLEQKLDAAINLHLNERGLLIRVYADKVRFAPGQASLSDPFKKILDKVAEILEVIPNAIEVNGYTDNHPVTKGGEAAKDNWTLSALRAVNTVKYLQTKNIAPERMSATGFGPYAPLVPNSDEIRRSMNRRIDIQVLKAPLLKELNDSQRVREEFNPEVRPMQAGGPASSPDEGVQAPDAPAPKPLTF
jgi:chemotaxis protein MotB